MSRWLPMDEAPHDRAILLDVGLPWSVVGMFNSINGEFVFACARRGLCEGVYNDTYFENEYEQSPKGWQEMPEIKRNAA